MSQRIQFSELLWKYILFCYISSYYPSWQGHRKKTIEFFMFAPQRSCIKFKLGSPKPGWSTWEIPVSYLEYGFSRLCLSNFNVRTKHWEFLIRHRLSSEGLGWGPRCCMSERPQGGSRLIISSCAPQPAGCLLDLRPSADRCSLENEVAEAICCLTVFQVLKFHDFK